MEKKRALQELLIVQNTCRSGRRDLDSICRLVDAAVSQVKAGQKYPAYDQTEAAYWELYQLKGMLEEAEYTLQRTMDILNDNRAFGDGGMVDDGPAVFMVEGMLNSGIISQIEALGGRVEMAGPGMRIDVRSNVSAIERILQESGRRYNKSTQSSINPRNPRLYERGGKIYDGPTFQRSFEVNRNEDDILEYFEAKGYNMWPMEEREGPFGVVYVETEYLDEDRTMIGATFAEGADDIGFIEHLEEGKFARGGKVSAKSSLRGNNGTYIFVETGIEDKMYTAAEKAGVEILEKRYNSKYDADMYLVSKRSSTHKIALAYIKLYGGLPKEGMYSRPMNRIEKDGTYSYKALKKGQFMEQGQLDLED